MGLDNSRRFFIWSRVKRKKKKSVTLKPLTARQRLFAVAVASGSTNIDAMRKAGYTGKPGTLSVEANRLLKLPKIAAHIETARAEVEKKFLAMTAEELLGEIQAIATSDITDYVTWDNNRMTFKPVELLTPHQRRAINSVRIKDTAFGKDRTITLHAKMPALDRLGQYLKLWGSKFDAELPGDMLERALFLVPGYAPLAPTPALAPAGGRTAR